MVEHITVWVTGVIAVCSLLHTVLPPWEIFNDYPSIQKWYKLMVIIIGALALNGRSRIYSSISTKSGTQLSEAATKSVEDK